MKPVSTSRWFALGLAVLVLVGIWSCSSGGGGGGGFDEAADAPRSGGATLQYSELQDSATHDRSSGAFYDVSDATIDGRSKVESEEAPNEELWVIGKQKLPAATPAPAPGPMDAPGSGSLWCTSAGAPVPLPLESTDVKARVLGFVASVGVTQRFANPYDAKIEAVYVFPLPEDAGVTGFVMTVGERRIRAVIREREDAERLYLRARAAGKVASLFTQERPNVFTQKVANIEPGRRIDVDITYFHACRFEDGWVSWVFPMVVGPRFNPPGSASGIGAVSRAGAGTSGQAVEVAYLRPGEPPGNRTGIDVEIDAGFRIAEVRSPTHQISCAQDDGGRARVALAAAAGRVPADRDFVLRWRADGAGFRGALLAETDGRDGGHFALVVFPPGDDGPGREPLDLVFVLDASGSMEGEPLRALKRAVGTALDGLGPDDTFQIVRFSEEAEVFGRRPLPATRQHLDEARRFLDGLAAGGGTMMLRGLDAALALETEEGRTRHLVFLTDGFIGNEDEVLGRLANKLGNARVFSFGIGSAPNRHLLEGMARLGRGAAAYVLAPDQAGETMRRWLERARTPAVADVAIDWGGLDVRDVLPAALPDLRRGRPVVVSGRYRGGGAATIRVRGRRGREPAEVAIPVDFGRARGPGDLARSWARLRIGDLEDGALSGSVDGAECDRLVKNLALDYGLASRLTAFVAVDARSSTEGSEGTTVPVAVPVPAGTRYGTTVGGK